jgi:hypothetical protein
LSQQVDNGRAVRGLVLPWRWLRMYLVEHTGRCQLMEPWKPGQLERHLTRYVNRGGFGSGSSMFPLTHLIAFSYILSSLGANTARIPPTHHLESINKPPCMPLLAHPARACAVSGHQHLGCLPSLHWRLGTRRSLVIANVVPIDNLGDTTPAHHSLAALLRLGSESLVADSGRNVP